MKINAHFVTVRGKEQGRKRQSLNARRPDARKTYTFLGSFSPPPSRLDVALPSSKFVIDGREEVGNISILPGNIRVRQQAQGNKEREFQILNEKQKKKKTAAALNTFLSLNT